MKIRKPTMAFLILIVATAVFASVIGMISYSNISSLDKQRTEFRLEKVQQMLDILEKDFSAEYDRYLERIQSVSELMAFTLHDFVENGEYTGPWTFDDGFVVRVKNGVITLPEDLSEIIDFVPELDPSLFASETSNIYVDPLNNVDLEKAYFVYTAKIAGPYYYVDITMQNEVAEAVYGTVRLLDTINDIEKSFNCRVLLVWNPSESGEAAAGQGEEVSFFVMPKEAESSAEFPSGKTPAELGLSRSVFTEKPESLVYGGKTYLSNFRYMTLLGYQTTVILLNNFTDYAFYAVNTVTLFVVLLLIAAVSLIMWIHWVQVYIRDNEISQAQISAYHPRSIYKRVGSVAVIGGIGIFLLAIFYQTITNLNRESIMNGEALKTVLSRLEEKTNNASERQKDEEDWMVYFAERVSDMMELNPGLRTKENLEVINDIIGIEYMMLFDHNGKEYASSDPVIGYSLSKTDFLKKFSDLLNGLNTLIGDPIIDENTQKTLQLTGTSIYVDDGNNFYYDVLILANDVGNSWQSGDERSVREFLENATPAGNLCIVIDKETNLVSYSSLPELRNTIIPGMKYTEGVSESSDLDTYVIRNTRYYGCFDSNEKYVVYYLTEESYIRGGSLLFAAAAGLGFAAVILLVCRFLLHSYNHKTYKATIKVRESSSIGDIDKLVDFFAKNDTEKDKSLKEKWQILIPDQKIRIFLEVILVFFIILGTIVLLSDRIAGFNLTENDITRSTINFILFGNWKRGFNLLGLAGVLFIVLGVVLFIFLKSVSLQALCSILDPKGETICRLTFSLIQYAVVIGGIYLMMGFLGFNTTFQLTSVGIVSLAISLGSQDIVADILAGIFIIFEGDFQVGDVVEIDGFVGVVQEIGVRSTKVLGRGDHLKIFNNKTVNNVLNKSKMNTKLTVEIKLPVSTPLLKVEKLMEENMSAIGKRIPEIIRGPYYKGVWNIDDWGKLIINVDCECSELNSRAVTYKLNRELLVLLETHGIEM